MYVTNDKKVLKQNATFNMICELHSEIPIHSDELFSEHIYFRDKTLIVGTTIMFASVIYCVSTTALVHRHLLILYIIK